ncbi:MAG: GNVR domain-containing protein [Thermodesulfobacteriota bacterium]|nr:GNVR domain-containing protein [Thermodesulfobacteriota bacterium]
MINPEKSFNIHDYYEIFLRRIWYIIIPFVIVLSGAVVYALYSPKEYRASTLILVTPQKVPEAFVRPTVTSKIEERLQSIGQEIMSRTRLEKVISEFKLYPEEAKSKSLEEIVEMMRANIKVEIKGKEGYFIITYIGKDPRMVTMVTNKLASLFIEENLKLREMQAQGTTEFLSIELKATQAKLEENEKTVTQFKRQFMGELPEQREANLKVLEQLQFNFQRIGENIRSAQDRKLIIQKQLSDTELLLASALSSSPGLNPLEIQARLQPKPVAKDPQELQLEQFKNLLADLQAKYTEKHPDILITKKKIVDLEAKIEKARLEKESEEKKESESKQDQSAPITVSPLPAPKIEGKKEAKEEKPYLRLNPRYKEMESQLIATELEIERLKEEEVKVKAQINKYRERIEVTPMRELAMAQLSRDYQNTREIYQTLLKKSEEAQQAENLERRQKGEQFKVLDPGRIPEKPFRPDIPKILLFGLLLGMGSGFGMAFFREQMDHSFRDAEDLEATLGFKVLANIPKIEKKAA